jgi:hypothetical protein
MSRSVCVLAPWEAQELLEDHRLPNCSQHRHFKLDEAELMTTPRGTVYHRPIAEWVGKGRRRIRMLCEPVWKRRKTLSNHVVWNLVER